ncbi:MAG: right-handed parallel beta-helix repeat-containing protein [Candidatus Helarchaeota archaeon]
MSLQIPHFNSFNKTNSTYITEYSSPLTIFGDIQLNATATAGNGTSGNPFIIENLIINGSGGNLIDISYTNAYFIIRNCTCINGSVGIHLYEVNNGAFFNNTVKNGGNGIWIEKADNIILQQNNFSYNSRGITLKQETNNVSVLKNNITFNQRDGIYSIGSHHNITIEGNLIFSNYERGISLAIENSTIIGNRIINNTEIGISIVGCKNTTILNNTITGSEYGLYLDSSSNNTFSLNNITQNSYGIYLIDEASGYSTNNTFTENKILNNTHGIYLKNANYNDIIGNFINNNTLNGIYLTNSNHNRIMNNELIYNTMGINETEDCYDNLMENNNIINKPSPSGLNMLLLLWVLFGTTFSASVLGGYVLYKRGKEVYLESSTARTQGRMELWLNGSYFFLIILTGVSMFATPEESATLWIVGQPGGVLILIGSLLLIPVFSCRLIALTIQDAPSQKIALGLAGPSWALILAGAIVNLFEKPSYPEIPILFIIFISLQTILGIYLFFRWRRKIRV